MNRIPAPSYENYSYGAGSLSMAHTSAYTGMGGADPMGAYSQQLHQYINDMQLRFRSTSDGRLRSEIQRNLNLAYSYLQMIGEEMPMDSSMGGSDWNPMGGGYRDPYGGIPEQGRGPQDSAGPSPSFQDSNKVIFEDPISSLTLSRNSDPREQRYYDLGEMTVNIPGGFNGRVTSEMVDGRQAVVLTTTRSADGSTRRYVFFNEKVKFVTSATNPANQITVDAAVPAGKVELKSRSATTEESRETASDEPHLWNTHNSVTHEMKRDAAAQTEIDNVFADNYTVHIENRQFVTEITKLGEGEYRVEYLNKPRSEGGTVLRTVLLHQVDHITLRGAPAENVFYRSSAAGTFKAMSDPDHETDSVLNVAGVRNESAEQLGDRANRTDPDGTRIFNGSGNANVSPVPSGTDKRSNVLVGGQFTLTPNSTEEIFTVERDPANPDFFIVKCYATDADKAAGRVKETFNVSMALADKFIFAGDASRIEFLGELRGSDAHHINTSNSFASRVQIGATTEVTGNSTADTILEAFKTALGGKTDAQILSALRANGFPYTNIEELKAAMNAEPATFPPRFEAPAGGAQFQNLIKALYALDSQFSGVINGVTWSHTILGPAFRQSTPRLVALLQALYPDHNISMTVPGANDDNWRLLNNITFDGSTINYTRQENGHQTEIEVTAVTSDDRYK